jgi:type I restriction enzyme, S subunit
MRADWKTKQLKELCLNYKNDIVDGPFGANLKRKDYTDSGIPVLKIQNIKPYAITLKNIDYVCKEKYEEIKRHSFKNGDIIMTKLGDPLGACAIVEGLENGVIVADLVRIRAQKIDTRYLCYHLNSPLTNCFINAKQQGATRPRVQISAVRELPIFVPSLVEQKRIVAVLDEAFEGIAVAVANAEKNLASARELFESRLNSIFTQKGEGWVENRLANVCENLDSHRIPITKSKRSGGDVPYYGASGVVDYVADYIFDEDLLLVSEDGANLLARTYPIAFSITGKAWVNNHAHVLRFEDVSSQKIVEYYLNSIPLHKYVNGMAQPKLNQKALNSITVPFPPLREQARLVEGLEALSSETQALQLLYRQKLAALAELKQPILQKAFAGELTAKPEKALEKALA